MAASLKYCLGEIQSPSRDAMEIHLGNLKRATAGRINKVN